MLENLTADLSRYKTKSVTWEIKLFKLSCMKRRGGTWMER